MNAYYVYILASKRNGTLYIGVTNDLLRRVHEHRKGAADGFTNKYGVRRLVYFEQTPSVTAAIAREKQLKKWNRQWKIELIEKSNPYWRDLFEDFVDDKSLGSFDPDRA
jgi:putative endonuclease